MRPSVPPTKSRSPGAMTRAMQAVATDAPAHAHAPVPRVALVRAGLPIDERLLLTDAPLTLGAHPSCTFTMPEGPGVPEHCTLLEKREGTWHLHLPKGAVARLADARGVRAIEADGVAVPIEDTTRGRVSWAGITVLFQFVPRPPPPVRAQLPQVLRARWTDNLDPRFHASLLACSLLASGGALHAAYLYDPEVDDMVEIDTRTIPWLTTPVVEATLAPPATATPATADPHATATPDPTTRPTRPHTPGSPAPTTRAAPSPEQRLMDSVDAANRAADAALRAFDRSHAQFDAIVSAAQGPRSAADRLRETALMDGSVDALAHARGVTTGAITRTSLTARADGLHADFSTPRTLTAPTVDVPLGTPVRERLPPDAVRLGPAPDPTDLGTLDARAVQATLRTGAGAYRSCYERALRDAPGLAGQVSVRLTIGRSGRVSSAESRGLDASQALGQCLVRSVQRLVFPQPEDGEVEFSFRLDFHAGD